MTGSKQTVQFADVWAALETSPQAAANLRLRSKLMLAVSDKLAARRSTRAKAAAMLGVSATKLAQLLEGEIDAFSVDELVAMAERAGLAVDVTIVPRAA